jgi:hypothetical protein
LPPFLVLTLDIEGLFSCLKSACLIVGGATTVITGNPLAAAIVAGEVLMVDGYLDTVWKVVTDSNSTTPL